MKRQLKNPSRMVSVHTEMDFELRAALLGQGFGPKDALDKGAKILLKHERSAADWDDIVLKLQNKITVLSQSLEAKK